MFKLIVALALLFAVFVSASAPPTYSRFWYAAALRVLLHADSPARAATRCAPPTALCAVLTRIRHHV